MDKNFSIVYDSSLANLCEVNSSFDRGVLRIAYHGLNRNNSSISKEVFEKAANTMFNCPVVCRYDRELDEIGSHDVEIVNDDKGLRMVNVTHPVGVVPSDSHWFWEESDDGNGDVKEYLCTEVLLWKREEAYSKIKSDGIVKHSMEITVLDSHKEDGVLVIDDFEFTAFCLLGTAEPCFEDSALLVYTTNDFKERFAEMMKEFKECFNSISTASAADNIFNTMTEGGERILEEKLALVEEYGLNVDDLEFALDDFSVEELREKFEAMKQVSAVSEGEDFSLEGGFFDELMRALTSETYETYWGEEPRFWFYDYDKDAMEVYSFDLAEDWMLVGHKFSVNGDSIAIDFESRTRKKFEIVNFDEGDVVNPIAEVFTKASEAYSKNDSEWAEKFQTASDTISSMNVELEELRKFKSEIEEAEVQKVKDSVFAKFEDLEGDEAFESLKESCGNYSADEIEEKCYAIRGRKGTSQKFSVDPKSPKLPVTYSTEDSDPEPYGGLFVEFGSKI